MNVRIGTFNVAWEKKLCSHFSIVAQAQAGLGIGKSESGPLPTYYSVFHPQFNLSSRYYIRNNANLSGAYGVFLLNYGKDFQRIVATNTFYNSITRVAHLGVGFQTTFWKYLFFDGNISYGISSSLGTDKRYFLAPAIDLHFGTFILFKK